MLKPVLMVLVYFGVLSPLALLIRLLGKVLRPGLRADHSAATYWISRAGQPASRMNQQF